PHAPRPVPASGEAPALHTISPLENPHLAEAHHPPSSPACCRHPPGPCTRGHTSDRASPPVRSRPLPPSCPRGVFPNDGGPSNTARTPPDLPNGAPPRESARPATVGAACRR